MDHIWLIPVIAVVVWVITAVARGTKAKEKVVDVNQGPQGRPPRRRPSSSDIDRFLEEVKRRQLEQRRRQAEPLEVEAVIIEPSPRPRPPPVRRPPPRSAVMQPVVVAEAVPLALPADTGLALAASKQQIAVPETVSGTPVPLHVLELLRLLQSPQGRRTALIINEVFGPPRSRRRR